LAQHDAPGRLELVRQFVNTLEDVDPKDLATADALRGWLAERGLLDAAARVRDAEAEHARGVREALRALLYANNGEEVDPGAARVLDDAAARSGVGLRFEPDGGTTLEPAATGVDGALGRLLAIVHAAMADGTWRRLKACRDHDCGFAFYDRSRNRSGVWCDMAVCGNRAKARTYRARRDA
jgi:predicted RNA-binding Zn ribbon-like protein